MVDIFFVSRNVYESGDVDVTECNHKCRMVLMVLVVMKAEHDVLLGG